MNPNEKLTFSQLSVGQKFIFFSSPGDNEGHGGFKGAHNVFEKTEDQVLGPRPGLLYGISHGRAVNIESRSTSDFPLSMSVILLAI